MTIACDISVRPLAFLASEALAHLELISSGS